MDAKRAWSIVGMSLLWSATPACGGDPALDLHHISEDTCQSSQAILGGSSATTDERWDAIGTIGYNDSSGAFQPKCTATLVSTRAVLTAKHCALAFESQSPPPHLLFAVGPDATKPKSRFALGSVSLATPDKGGFTGFGSDVAVYSLRNAPSGANPLPIAPQSLVNVAPGTQLLAVGYGAATIDESRSGAYAWRRRQGTQTMRRASGNLLEMIYGNRENCRLDRSILPGRPPSSTQHLATDCSAYEQTGLLVGQEAWAGGEEGDAQTCQGDSGGPLLIESCGTMKVIGVTSWSWRSAEQRCDYGTIFAAVSDDTRQLVLGTQAP